MLVTRGARQDDAKGMFIKRAIGIPARLPANLLASLLLIGSFTIFTIMAVLIRTVGDTVPVVEVILVRQLIAFLLLAPWFWVSRARLMRPVGLRLHLARGFFQFGAMSCGLTATILIPLADVTAIQMSEVLIATALAALILREHVGWRRWTAGIVGFIGVVVMLKPFGGGFNSAALIALLGALCGGASMIAVRMGSAHDTTISVLFWQGLVVLALVLAPASWFWVTPSAEDWAILALMGVLFTIGLWLFTAGLRLGDASALAPLHYLRLLMMAAIGWWIYAEVPTASTAIGGILILSAATYTLARNARRASKVEPSVAAPP
jgi:drug/metabolite transporter (DMT)-like permease